LFLFGFVLLQWNLLLADYSETVESIEDIRDIAENFEELCQRNLAANSGGLLSCCYGSVNTHEYYY
jgi:hypothetical protein